MDNITQGQLFNFISGSHVSGDSSYEIWKALGNEGEQQDFLNSLKGDKGDKGEQGIQGVPGTRKITVLFDGNATTSGTYTLSDYVNKYDEIVVFASLYTSSRNFGGSFVILKNYLNRNPGEAYSMQGVYNRHVSFNFSSGYNKISILLANTADSKMYLSKVIGIKYST